MLVLTRKINEDIKIGSDITIKILSISENQIKLGIDAPRNVQIYRNEVFEKVKESTIEASRASIQKETDLFKYKIQRVK
ncbi:MAG: carbon storage regulator CsrA [Ignavibacteriales bacterium]|nr:carbon storage regulator CsrA [Ignavibacteriales bacterium]